MSDQQKQIIDGLCATIECRQAKPITSDNTKEIEERQKTALEIVTSRIINTTEMRVAIRRSLEDISDLLAVLEKKHET